MREERKKTRKKKKKKKLNFSITSRAYHKPLRVGCGDGGRGGLHRVRQVRRGAPHVQKPHARGATAAVAACFAVAAAALAAAAAALAADARVLSLPRQRWLGAKGVPDPPLKGEEAFQTAASDLAAGRGVFRGDNLRALWTNKKQTRKSR